jgi:hypothetical protein
MFLRNDWYAVAWDHEIKRTPRNFQTLDRGLAFRIRDGQAAVFAEDMEILEARQANIFRRPESAAA